jgi:hypothetical protein
VPDIEVDTNRLRVSADTLGTYRGTLEQAKSELDGACGTVRSASGHVADGGLPGAIGHLLGNWQFDIDGIAKDLDAMSQVIRTLAEMYGMNDEENAELLRE